MVEIGLALACAALLGTGGVAAADLREDERVARAKAAAELAERQRVEAAAKARTAYLSRLDAAMEQVYDHVQPVQQAIASVDDDRFASLFVLEDVVRRGGAASAVAARQRELAAVEVPGPLDDAAGRIDGALGDVVAALTDLQRLPGGTASEDYLDGLIDGGTDLDLATDDLTRAVQQAFGDDELPSLPLANGTKAEGRPPVSKGSFLLTVGEVCASSASRSKDLDSSSPDALVASFRRELADIRATVRLLRGVKGPAKDAARISGIRTALDGTATLAQGLQELERAVKAQDLAAYQRGLATLDRSDRQSAAIAKAYRTYGSVACNDYFAP